jgi:hypothetical protein
VDSASWIIGNLDECVAQMAGSFANIGLPISCVGLCRQARVRPQMDRQLERYATELVPRLTTMFSG